MGNLRTSILNTKMNSSAKIYTCDLSNGFNKSYVTEEDVNKNPTDASELKVKNPTLIVFENNKISEYYEGEDEISNYVNK